MFGIITLVIKYIHPENMQFQCQHAWGSSHVLPAEASTAIVDWTDTQHLSVLLHREAFPLGEAGIASGQGVHQCFGDCGTLHPQFKS